MTCRLRSSILIAFCFAPLSIVGCRPADKPAPTPSLTAHVNANTLQPFADEAQLRATLEKFRASAKARATLFDKVGVLSESADAAADASAAAPMEAAAGAVADKESDKPDAEESITNVQTAGVDEGGIVKRRGDHLIVLRRGRLFTLRIGGDDLKPIASIDAYGPGIDPNGAWYDEMLVSGRTIAVIGYSYQRGGTEIGLFDLDESGGLKYRATYHLRSNDYYSSRNYASRMIGDKLVFYSPMFLNMYAENYEDMLPALRHWQSEAKGGDVQRGDSQNGEFQRILPAERIYRGRSEPDPDQDIALHTVTVCDLAAPEMRCEATAVMGYPGQVFYVSEDSAFVWTVPWNAEIDRPKLADVFRIPLDGSAPTALQAKGAPIDQMSFLQQDDYLNVMLSANGMGQWMWQGESTPGQSRSGDFALMRVPLSMFSDGREAVASAQYRPLREQVSGHNGMQNRFVGDWLILGASRSWDETPAQKDAFAIRYARNDDFVRVPIGHPVDRVDALGRDGIVIGESEGALHFTSLALSDRAEAMGRFTLPNASQGEQRTHGFFYRATGEREGVVGLPIIGGDTARGNGGASVLYLRNRALHLQEAGKLDALRTAEIDDACKASCVDWYGNARPIFIGERVFALLGYELVEGRFEGPRIRERRRIDFSPQVSIAE
jgi:Beta propeller domain